jgi:hypothetical protein
MFKIDCVFFITLLKPIRHQCLLHFNSKKGVNQHPELSGEGVKKELWIHRVDAAVFNFVQKKSPIVIGLTN